MGYGRASPQGEALYVILSVNEESKKEILSLR